MSILVDQCVPRKYLRLLHEWGYTADLVQSHLSANAEDASVLALAQRLDAVLLTADLDFAQIIEYPPQNYQGIVVLRYRAEDETAITNVLRQALKDLYRDSLRSALVIISANRYRVRREAAE
jgi:predicted nuclease of predicted toxin-antitoxin system